ncbi:DNA-directed RNA polymerase I subunit RPA34.5-domain-containing protein [Rostrohypoxylon terebratum]|nr:DNA-directed RNA polymerase I subunit RPA34.5-domain-containing protein [Rostrohypoxylon terebratum]
MSKNRSRAPIASLDSLVSRVRDQKAATTPSSSIKSQIAKQLAQASDSESDGSSSEDSDGSDSESEVDVEAARKKFAAKQQSKRNDAKHKSIPQKSQSAKSTPIVISKPSKPIDDVEDSDFDSDSNSDSDSSSQSSIPAGNSAQKPTTTKEASKSGAEEDSGSESESSSEGETEEEEEEEEEEVTSAKQSADVDSSSDDDGESSSSGDDEESTHEAMDIDHGNKTVVNGNATTQSSTSEVSRPAWIDNSSFTLRKASSDNPAKDIADFFKNTNLEGKQVWYFTAPASLPITVLKDMEIDLSKATTGEALLNHNGDNYGLDIESHATSTQIQLLIPSQGGDKYAALDRGIDSTVHLRRIAKFGPGGTVSSTAAENYAPAPKVIREQPEGLKPRFTPIGVPTPTVQISTSAASKSKGSKESDVANGQLKRKHPGHSTKQSTLEQGPQTQGKSTKRAKTSKLAAPEISSTPMTIDTPSKARTPADKDQAKKAAKDAFKPKKQTPVPIPHVPSMSMKR